MSAVARPAIRDLIGQLAHRGHPACHPHPRHQQAFRCAEPGTGRVAGHRARHHQRVAPTRATPAPAWFGQRHQRPVNDGLPKPTRCNHAPARDCNPCQQQGVRRSSDHGHDNPAAGSGGNGVVSGGDDVRYLTHRWREPTFFTPPGSIAAGALQVRMSLMLSATQATCSGMANPMTAWHAVRAELSVSKVVCTDVRNRLHWSSSGPGPVRGSVIGQGFYL